MVSLHKMALFYQYDCENYPGYEDIHKRQYFRMVIWVLTGRLKLSD